MAVADTKEVEARLRARRTATRRDRARGRTPRRKVVLPDRGGRHSAAAVVGAVGAVSTMGRLVVGFILAVVVAFIPAITLVVGINLGLMLVVATRWDIPIRSPRLGLLLSRGGGGWMVPISVLETFLRHIPECRSWQVLHMRSQSLPGVCDYKISL